MGQGILRNVGQGDEEGGCKGCEKGGRRRPAGSPLVREDKGDRASRASLWEGARRGIERGKERACQRKAKRFEDCVCECGDGSVGSDNDRDGCKALVAKARRRWRSGKGVTMALKKNRGKERVRVVAEVGYSA